jgi:hypothetical protein
MNRKKTYRLIGFSVTIFASILSFLPVSGFSLTAWAASRADVIRGRVVSRYGPVKNARVRIPGHEDFTLTDRQGYFQLKADHTRPGPMRVTAGKEGWFNNGQFVPPGNHPREIFLNPVYMNDRFDYRFVSPVVCAQCHGKLARYWDKSKMAHAASNPKLLDMYYGTDAFHRRGIGPGYKLDFPGDDGNCAVCHAPSAASRPPFSRDLRTLLSSRLLEWDGISCDYCHKVRKVIEDPATPSGAAALLERQTSRTDRSILVFGPYDDVAVPPMAASYNSTFEQGNFCATCHSHLETLNKGKTWDHSAIYTDSEWKGFGLKGNSVIPVQTTYQEWKQWQDRLAPNDPNKGKKCQDCHMSWRKEMLPYDNYIVDGMARNMWGVHRPAKTIHPHHFDGGTGTQLKTALAMEIDGEIKEKTLHVTVYITNTNGGHWVPTGETMRSVMVLVKATDSKGKALKLVKGGTLPDWTGVGKPEEGNYAGLPGQVFARVLADDRGNLNAPFWRATRVAMDTRIRPKGSVTLTYDFAIENPDDEPTAEAQLVYRPVIKPLARQKNWAVKDIVIASKVW